MRGPTLQLVAAGAMLWSATLLPGQKLWDVYRPPAGVHAAVLSPFQHGIAVMRDGGVWVTLRRREGKDTHLVLVHSLDGGRSFAEPIRISKKPAYHGSMVADPSRPDRLHIIWSQHSDLPALGVHYQALDTSRRTLIGKPELLLQGRGRNDQFHASDIDVLADGSLAVAAFAHRAPNTKVWRSGWSGALLWRRAGAATWDAPRVVNQGYSGINMSLQAIGNDLAFSYRSSAAKGHGIHFRRFEGKTARWATKEQIVRATRRIDRLTVQPTNTSSMVVDPSGNAYLLFTEGATAVGAGKGALLLGFRPRRAKPGEGFRSVLVAEDAVQRGGNRGPLHYALALGPGHQVFAIYSKAAEKFRKLYARVFVEGHPVTKERVIGAGGVNAFVGVNGFRSSAVDTTILAVVHGEVQGGRTRVAMVVPRLPVRSFWRIPLPTGPKRTPGSKSLSEPTPKPKPKLTSKPKR